MPPIILEPSQVPPGIIVRSMARSFVAGLLGGALLWLDNGWLAMCAIVLLLYALTGLLWYPLAERRLRREIIRIDADGIAWPGQSLAYHDIALVLYRQYGAHDRQLRLKGGHSGHAIALQHYRLPAGLDDRSLAELLAERVRSRNPRAVIDI